MLNRKSCLAIFALPLLLLACAKDKVPERPNILFCISDDQSYPHAGAYGCEWVETPAFDRVAANGLLFTNAYTNNAKCAPSRAIVLTGRYSWQLEEAANHICYFPTKYKTFFEVLQEAGYKTGRTAKGWGPGIAQWEDGARRELVGKHYGAIKTTPPALNMEEIDYAANFDVFLDEKEDGEPFAFWYGSREPHRAYEYGAGIKYGGKQLSDIDSVPPYWPDNDSVRTDMLDYAFEVEHFDTHLGRMIKALEQRDLLKNTIVIVTSDNGMPFPRCKAQNYPSSCHMPLAIMWPDGIEKPGRVITDFVSFIDVAPTCLELAKVDAKAHAMAPISGESLVSIFQSPKVGRVMDKRDHVVVGRERHDAGRPNDVGYPIRAIVTDDYTYIHNFKPDRWPAGRPETGYLDCDGGPTKTATLNAYETEDHALWQYSFGRRTQEELYDLGGDKSCMYNLSQDSTLAYVQEGLKERLFSLLKGQEDPRVLGRGDVFDEYMIIPRQHAFYKRFMAGEEVNYKWVNESDFRSEQNGDFVRQ